MKIPWIVVFFLVPLCAENQANEDSTLSSTSMTNLPNFTLNKSSTNSPNDTEKITDKISEIINLQNGNSTTGNGTKAHKISTNDNDTLIENRGLFSAFAELIPSKNPLDLIFPKSQDSPKDDMIIGVKKSPDIGTFGDTKQNPINRQNDNHRLVIVEEEAKTTTTKAEETSTKAEETSTKAEETSTKAEETSTKAEETSTKSSTLKNNLITTTEVNKNKIIDSSTTPKIVSNATTEIAPLLRFLTGHEIDDFKKMKSDVKSITKKLNKLSGHRRASIIKKIEHLLARNFSVDEDDDKGDGDDEDDDEDDRFNGCCGCCCHRGSGNKKQKRKNKNKRLNPPEENAGPRFLSGNMRRAFTQSQDLIPAFPTLDHSEHDLEIGEPSTTEKSTTTTTKTTTTEATTTTTMKPIISSTEKNRHTRKNNKSKKRPGNTRKSMRKCKGKRKHRRKEISTTTEKYPEDIIPQDRINFVDLPDDGFVIEDDSFYESD